ncbi:hypothetical protein [Streptococcus macacae]|uniref:Membrane protein n=1 Tax=Streptococcus macacae NCTC 11558 TaxID=764298 RepID=G5JWY2_9STRE|nr:hypothetical protein [Streptococcus macacae]EHJ51719.1 putative membrane protein [Streptococcus macacae NCTC 11558]SUN79458.1 ABC transporter permease [Streptococcus macacae NCTC 11558]
MNWKNIWELIKINILYSNPQALTNIQRRQARKPNKNLSSYKSVIRQQVSVAVLFIFIYAYMFLNIDYRHSKGYFSFQIAMFILIAIVSGFTTLFAVFYDSNDTKLYLPLPVKESEVYIAKVMSSQGGSLPFLMPIIPLSMIAYLQLSNPILAVFGTLINFLIALLLSNAISILLVYFIGQMLVKSPYKKTISTVLMVVSTLLAVGVVFYLSSQSNNNSIQGNTSIQMPLLPYFRGFIDVIINPLSTASLLNFWLGLLVLAGLLLLIKRVIIKNYFKQFLSIQATKAHKRKKVRNTKNQTLSQTLRRHHLSTIKDGTLILQTYLMPLIFVFAFLAPSLSRGGLTLSGISNSFFGVALLLGVMFGNLISASANTFLAVGISLEKDNYIFLKTLPISFKKFLISKFLTLSTIQLSIPIIIYLLVGLFLLKTPIILIVSFSIGTALAALITGQILYWRDYRLLNLTWQNVTQLFSRGIGQWFSFITLMAVIIGGSMLTALSIILALQTSALIISFILTLLILALLAPIQLFIYHRFWKKLI